MGMFGDSHRMNVPGGSSSKHERSGRVFGVSCDREGAVGRKQMRMGRSQRMAWGCGGGGVMGGPEHRSKA